MPRKLIPLIIVSLMVLPTLMAVDVTELPDGFEGVSWDRVVPVKKATFVQFDETTFVDDFAYLAAVPASVFYDDETGRIYSYPLMFYEDYVTGNNETLSLNARQGLDYFMEDWLTYNDGTLNEIECINVADVPWDAANYTHINGNDTYEIASEIALHDWSYSDTAVVAVVGDVNYGSYNTTENSITGTLTSKEVKKVTVTGIKQDSIAPQYNDFYVPPGYQYIKADLYWPSVSWLPNFMYLATLMMLGGGVTIPAADPDLQLYCYYEGELMEVSASQVWNIMHGPHEHTETYVYNSGKWKAAIEDIPTKGLFGDRSGTLMQRLMDILSRKVTYYIDISLYPGEEITIPDTPPFMARNAEFELSWNGEGKLGLILIDENNVAVGQAILDNVSKQTLHLDQLGEGHYRAVIVQLTERSGTMDFELHYSWEQMAKENECDYLMNAAEGAVLASTMNAPLLYVAPDAVPECTEDAAKKLGVKHIYFVDIGGNATMVDDMKTLGKIENTYIDIISMYHDIRNVTHENDIVFTTIDPWTYYYTEKLQPEGTKQGALYLGPAAYAAAHHGAPLIAVDMHEELSTAVVWYNEWWKIHAIRDIIPPVAEMYLCGTVVYNFLDNIGLDKPGEVETIITVADQFDIGIPWDRTFAGPANAGRILGTPVDTAYWVCRNAFYPAVIFVNPAVSTSGTRLINGSSSMRLASGRLNVIKESEEEQFMYPVLNSWITYAHRFNERASKYWGFNYTTPTGLTPFFTPSTNPIDQNILKDYGKIGSYYPDLSESEVIPFYYKKSGYSVAYTTNFTATMENINRGVIMWEETTHGWWDWTGSIAFWDPYGVPGFVGINISLPTVDRNPWRGYELYLPGWFDGSTEEPDVLSQSKLLGLDIVPARLSDIPFIKNSFIGRRAGYDGIIITVLFARLRTKDYTGMDIDAALKNVHSMGFAAGSCFISNTYLHLALIRHGSVFQTIDPWETSWYNAFAYEMFTRDLALGKSVGEAYTNGVLQTGVGYLTKQWYWDIKENICYFGDPDLHMYSPKYSWEKPESFGEPEVINGHALFGATEYPHEETGGGFGMYIIVLLVIVVVAGVLYLYFYMRKEKKVKQ